VQGIVGQGSEHQRQQLGRQQLGLLLLWSL
jgi:hypothetical protein